MDEDDLQRFMDRMPLASIFYGRFDIKIGQVIDFQWPKDVFHSVRIFLFQKGHKLCFAFDAPFHKLSLLGTDPFDATLRKLWQSSHG